MLFAQKHQFESSANVWRLNIYSSTVADIAEQLHPYPVIAGKDDVPRIANNLLCLLDTNATGPRGASNLQSERGVLFCG
jgi:hypothetical protein